MGSKWTSEKLLILDLESALLKIEYKSDLRDDQNFLNSSIQSEAFGFYYSVHLNYWLRFLRRAEISCRIKLSREHSGEINFIIEIMNKDVAFYKIRPRSNQKSMRNNVFSLESIFQSQKTWKNPQGMLKQVAFDF